MHILFVTRNHQTETNQPDQSPCCHPRTAMAGVQDQLALQDPRRRARPPRTNEHSAAHQHAVPPHSRTASVALGPAAAAATTLTWSSRRMAHSQLAQTAAAAALSQSPSKPVQSVASQYQVDVDAVVDVDVMLCERQRRGHGRAPTPAAAAAGHSAVTGRTVSRSRRTRPWPPPRSRTCRSNAGPCVCGSETPPPTDQAAARTRRGTASSRGANSRRRAPGSSPTTIGLLAFVANHSHQGSSWRCCYYCNARLQSLSCHRRRRNSHPRQSLNRLHQDRRRRSGSSSSELPCLQSC